MTPRDRLRDVDAPRTRVVPSPAPARATSLLTLQQAAGNRAVARLLSRAPQPRAVAAHDVPWRGEVTASWNAALRRTPHKDADDPYANIVADLTRGTTVTVIDEEHGWLHVEVELGGKKRTGYVSHELVRYTGPVVAPSEPAVPATPTFDARLFPTPAAFVALKRAENRRLAIPDWVPSADEQRELDHAADWLEDTGRFRVDRKTFVVSFVPGSTHDKIKVETIEDFVLFVETVERQYPQATPGEIAGEIRQIWFSGPNWQALLNSPGVTVGGKEIDMESERDPIEGTFDIPALKSTGHKLATALGPVDISHVVAGIDAALNGAAKVPDSDPELRYKTLRTADAGDPRDFATWSGDIGQAYAEYLVSRYVDGSTQSLQAFVDTKASPEQLLGDIHGYIATEVWKQTPPNVGTGWWTAGMTGTLSNILRNHYLVDKRGSAGAGTYRSFFEKASGKSGAGLRDFVVARSVAFARPWYAKVAASDRGKVGSWFHDPSASLEGALSGLMHEFDEKHAENERSAAEQDKLGGMIDRFLQMLAGSE